MRFNRSLCASAKHVSLGVRDASAENENHDDRGRDHGPWRCDQRARHRAGREDLRRGNGDPPR